jgi:excisionase family DNA binding protein
MPSERPVGTPMSPAHAAQSKNVSRRTIMRAIETHELKARRDNRNHWKITPEDLDRWADAQSAPTGEVHPVPTPQDSVETLARVARLEAENSQLRERLSEIKEDRDAWKEMAQRRRRWFWR